MYSDFITRSSTAIGGLLLSLSNPAGAQDGFELELSGAIDDACLLLHDFDAMEQTTIETTTNWTDGVNTFSGVSLKTLLEGHNATGTMLEMTAFDGHCVRMPIAEIDSHAPIVATRMNGEPLSEHEKGPYWIIFPYDFAAKYDSEIVCSRSIWQLDRLAVIEQ